MRAPGAPGADDVSVADDTMVVQDLALCGIEVDGDDVVVGLYGGAGNACGSVRFTFPDAEVRERRAAQLRRWDRDGTTLTLVARGTTISLVNERTVLERALQP
jgi:hypothetical protein